MTSKICFLTVVLFFNSFLVFAKAETKVKLVEIDADEKRGAAEITGDVSSISEGQEMVAQKENGNTCRMRVKSIKGHVAQLDLAGCAKSVDQIKVPSTLVPSLITVDSESAASSVAPSPSEAAPEESGVDHSDSKFKLFAKIFYSFADQLVANKISSDQASASGSVTFDSERAPGLAVEVFKGQKNGWGIDGGIEVESKRKINTQSATVAGLPVAFASTTDPKASFTIGDVYGNAFYRWSEFYIPFGLNLSWINLTGATNGARLHGTAGVQVGVGWMFTPHLALEVLDRVVQFTGTYDQSLNSGDYGTISLAGAQISLKYGWDLF